VRTSSGRVVALVVASPRAALVVALFVEV